MPAFVARCPKCDILVEEKHLDEHITQHDNGGIIARAVVPNPIPPMPPDSFLDGRGKAIPGHTHALEAVRTLLRLVGQDPDSEELRDTPERVVKALHEMTAGYRENPAEVLGRVFPATYDEMVLLRGIPFSSLCEHHLLVFSGTADVAYIPGDKGGKVVGLSKLARLVDVYARRLQMQERMTQQIATAIMECLNAQGAAVVVRGVHSCMQCRGVKKAGAEMVTSCMLGIFRHDPRTRSEFLALCNE